MAIKANDFLIINFSAKLKSTGEVFDSTFPDEAKKLGIENPKPVKVIVGQEMIVKGLDESFLGREEGEEYTIEVPPEKAFGKRDPSLVKLIPMKEFKKQGITPYPGMQLRIDNIPARVITVSSGRVVIDFNFPLAGKDIIYKVKIEKVIKDPKEKIDTLLEMFNIQAEKEYKDKSVIIRLEKDLPESLKNEISKKIQEFTGYEAKFEVKSDGVDNKERKVENGE